LKRIITVSFILLVALVLAACSNESSNNNEDNQDDTEKETAIEPATFEGEIIEVNDDSEAQRQILVKITNDLTDYYNGTEKIWLENHEDKLDFSRYTVGMKIKVWTSGSISQSNPPIIIPTKIETLSN